ncbi:MAG: hypothetical protein KatS3mg044_0061 [Rhodothermaceae bacterium]|nr:MAG: SPOR domain-containing protein [Bacteroidota bacterium]GIV61195.1 MAG: hypothetical protein KatS3mg044_0061 [Rhodothermaceae bacterium]
MIDETKIRRAGVLGALVLCTVMWAACSGGRAATDTTGDDTERPTYTLADFEDFDPTPYVDEPIIRTATVEHDVPRELMQGQAGAGVEQLVQGYRIQIQQSLNKEEAFQAEADVLAWWASLPQEERPVSDLSVYVTYHQPYYRVRVGDFTDREAADRLLALIKQRFPSAFVAPDVVTVLR